MNWHQILYSNATDLKLGSSTYFFLLFPFLVFTKSQVLNSSIKFIIARPIEFTFSPLLFHTQDCREFVITHVRIKYLFGFNQIINLQQAVTAAETLMSRYSLYMLWDPLRESYRNQTPKFLICKGFFSKIWKRK